MCGESIGNGQTIQFCDTLNIIALQNDMLTLGKGEMYRIEYRRVQENTTPLIGGSDAAWGIPILKSWTRR